MTAMQLFSNKRAFVKWMSDASSGAFESGARVGVGYDPISWSLKAMALSEGEEPDWAIMVVPLPVKASHAKQIWESIQEDNLCLFHCLETDLRTVLVAARHGLWRAIDDRLLPIAKAAFREISDGEAEELIGDRRVWSALCGEVQMFGIGCRVLQRSTSARCQQE